MSIEQEPQAELVLGFQEMERAIQENDELVNDTFALLRMQSRFGGIIVPDLENELRFWATSARSDSRIIDQLELRRITTERGATVWQRRESGVDTTPNITPYYERSQTDTDVLKEIFARYSPNTDV